MKKSWLLTLALPAFAQDALSLRDAVRLGLRENKGIAAAVAADRAAEARTSQARSGSLPKVNYSETFARSDNPVFVFSSLLTQRQFGAANFDIPALNRPDFLNNFQSRLTVDQPIYDGGQTRHAVRSAELGQKISAEDQRRSRMEVISGIARAYYGVLLAAESFATAEQAVHSVQADLRRAEAVRQAGMATDVDVLSIRVHLAGVEEQRIARAADLDVAKAALNDALGIPLDVAHRLTTALTPLDLPDLEVAALEREAAERRPEVRQTSLAGSLARVQGDAARALFLPTVGFHGAFEADRGQVIRRGGANWLAMVSLRWNLFNGNADKAKAAEAGHWLERANAEAARASSAVRLQVRRAYADLRAARQRIEVARAAVAEAEESLRITQNRYQAGMANVTDLLRNETAVLASRTRRLAAVHDQRVAATMLEFAAGRLTVDSEVLN
jgi:outer membrane protein